MLVIISDLHFVDETTGKHNVPLSAFQDVFLSDIASLAKRKDAQEIKLVLLGDIVDLIRTEQWFLEDMTDRPWGDNGLKDVPTPRAGSATERRCQAILGQIPEDWKKPTVEENTILFRNWDTFEFFRNFGARLRDDYGFEKPVEVIYLPGNHDRLCNLYPSLRDWMVRVLGLTIHPGTIDGDPASGSWWFRYDFLDERYGVYARHGHQFNPIDYGGENDHTRPAQLKASVGDVFTTEFAVRLPLILRKNPAVSRELVASLEDMDNVRPLSSVLEWFYYQVKSHDQGLNRQAMEDAFRTVVEAILDIGLVQRWRSSKTHTDDWLRLASSSWLRWLAKDLVDALGAEDLLPALIGGSESSAAPEDDDLCRGAYYEQIWRSNPNIQFILYGHTHVPLLVPLDRVGNREVLYVNTGTWRDRIYRSINLAQSPAFSCLKQMTYVTIFGKDEDKTGKSPGSVSIDVWTGHRRKG